MMMITALRNSSGPNRSEIVAEKQRLTIKRKKWIEKNLSTVCSLPRQTNFISEANFIVNEIPVWMRFGKKNWNESER